jgi:hypothetical protein
MSEYRCRHGCREGTYCPDSRAYVKRPFDKDKKIADLEAVNLRLRAELTKCLTHLEWAQKRASQGAHDDCIKSAETCLYETL